MMIHGAEFRLATNADVPQVAVLLAGENPPVYVVDEYNYSAAVLLTEFVKGPVTTLEEDNHFVICGFARRTGIAGKLRIADGVLQHQTVQSPEWSKKSGALALRLYVPASLPIPA